MAVTLAIADNADGTGVVATVSGSAAGSTNAVYRATFTGVMQAYALAAVGSRTGDGTVSVAGTGYYLWQVLSTPLVGAVEASNLVYRAATDAATRAVYDRILEATVTQLNAIGLSGLGATKILRKWLPRAFEGVEPSPPLCLVAPFVAETYPGTLSNQDDIGYPVVVVTVDVAQGDATARLARNLLWREQISRAFRNQRLPGVSEVIYCQIEPQTVLSPEWFSKNYLFHAHLFRFIAREPRGLGV